jgi:hypothetical protein
VILEDCPRCIYLAAAEEIAVCGQPRGDALFPVEQRFVQARRYFGQGIDALLSAGDRAGDVTDQDARVDDDFGMPDVRLFAEVLRASRSPCLRPGRR